MDNFLDNNFQTAWADRVDGQAKVTGTARYAVEHHHPNMSYGVLVGSTIAKGSILEMLVKPAENAPGVLAVITHLNCPPVPGFKPVDKTSNPGGQEWPGLRIFASNRIYSNGQPIALVLADSLEQATYAASLIKAKYDKQAHITDLKKNISAARDPRGRPDVYTRGEADAYNTAEVKLEAEYIMPIETHNPMEMNSIIAVWEGDEKLTVYDKTQGLKEAQADMMRAFDLKEENVKVIAEYVGGGFGNALRTWPHEIAAAIGARKIKRPVKLMLTRDQMFTMVGYRPYAWQQLRLGANKDGRLTGIKHEVLAQTSSYETFAEGIVNATKFLYACPNVHTSQKLVPLDVATPIWMRGPGEATGCFALESALDELSYKLGIDPIELRLRNYAETDPEKNLPWSSKYLRECYQLGAEKIGWTNRKPGTGALKEDGMLIGYGMGSGVFSAMRWVATARGELRSDGSLLLQSAVSDMGPGTATAMTRIAGQALGLPTNKIRFQLGDSSLPPGPLQGGSATTSTLGSAVFDVCESLKARLTDLLISKNPAFAGKQKTDLQFRDGKIIAGDASSSYADAVKLSGEASISITLQSKGGDEQRKYSMYSYSVHFVKLAVNPRTGVVRIKQVVTTGDAGKIVSEKTARSQMVGGVVGGIGMALTEESIIDHRYGRYINNNLADYHVPVNADVPYIDAIFVNKPDPIINPMGAKGMGEIALIGFAAAVANAVYNATGKRIRELPITPDKLLT